MAQETAGTIGIPVLKNEILPYMADYQRRRDRYAALEAQREAKLADLEYKRQMEREKAVTALPGVAGNYYSGILQQMQAADLDEMQRAAKDPSVPFGALNQKGAIVKTENETRNNIANQRSKEIDETVKQAGQYGVRITPDLIGSHLSQRWGTAPTRDSRFFGESDAEQIFGRAVSDINNVNLNRLGEAMIGKSSQRIEQIETPDRKSDFFQYYDVFKPVKQKGTVAGIDVLSAGPVDIDRADAIFRSDPIASTIRDNAVKQMIAANKANPNFAVLDAIQQEREAKQAFYDQVFANYKGQTKYVRSLEQGRAGRAGGGTDKDKPKITETPLRAVVTQMFTDDTGKKTKVDRTFKFRPGNSVTFPKPMPIGSNKRVFVLGGAVDDAVKAKILVPYGNQPGEYILNTGFQLKGYSEIPTLYRLTKDTKLSQNVTYKDGTKKTLTGTVPRGTWITGDQVVALTKEGKSGNFERIKNGIRFTPQIYQETVDKYGDATGSYRGPKLENLDLVILKDEFDEIAEIKKNQPPAKKFSAFK